MTKPSQSLFLTSDRTCSLRQAIMGVAITVVMATKLQTNPARGMAENPASSAKQLRDLHEKQIERLKLTMMKRKDSSEQPNRKANTGEAEDLGLLVSRTKE